GIGALKLLRNLAEQVAGEGAAVGELHHRRPPRRTGADDVQTGFGVSVIEDGDDPLRLQRGQDGQTVVEHGEGSVFASLLDRRARQAFASPTNRLTTALSASSSGASTGACSVSNRVSTPRAAQRAVIMRDWTMISEASSAPTRASNTVPPGVEPSGTGHWRGDR